MPIYPKGKKKKSESLNDFDQVSSGTKSYRDAYNSNRLGNYNSRDNTFTKAQDLQSVTVSAPRMTMEERWAEMNPGKVSPKIRKDYLNLPPTDLRRKDVMTPNQRGLAAGKTGEAGRNHADFHGDVMSAFTPLPVLESVGKVPSLFKSVRNTVGKIYPKTKTISKLSSDVPLDKMISNNKPTNSISSSIDDISKGSNLKETGHNINPLYHENLFKNKKESVIKRLSTEKGKKRLQDFIDENFKRNPENYGNVNSEFLPWLKSGFKDYSKMTPDDFIKNLDEMSFVSQDLANTGKDNAFHWFNKGVGNPSVMNIGESITPYDALHTIEHEMAHFFQRGKTSNVDDILSKLKLKEKKGPSQLNNYKSDVPLNEPGYSNNRSNPAYNDFDSPLDYFKTGSGGEEKMAMAAELRENLLQRGIITDYYDDITPELLRKHKDIYDKTGGSKYLQRIYEIMEDSPENYNILSQALNKMPQVAMPAAGAVVIGSQNRNKQKSRIYPTKFH